jgi:hypothetical protein
MCLTKESAWSGYRYSACLECCARPINFKLYYIRSQPRKIFVMSNILEFNCWVLGDDLRSAFPVKITSSETVDYLKEAIRDKVRGM